MERDRKIKMLSIIALVIAIIGMSLGFAAFSSTLSISSSASVSPDSSTFSVGFYEVMTNLTADDSGYITPTTSGGAIASNVESYPGITALSGLSVNFKEPGQSATYSFYVGNSGEYDAYLRAINFANTANASTNKVCTAGTDTTDSLVQAACDDIVLTINVHDISASASNTNISGKVLTKKTFTPITVTIEYLSTGDRADGDFSVSFGDISLDYSTVDGNNLITFIVDDIEYQTTGGISWNEWINSDENINGVSIGKMRSASDPYCMSGYELIIDGEEYFTDGCFVGDITDKPAPDIVPE